MTRHTAGVLVVAPLFFLFLFVYLYIYIYIYIYMRSLSSHKIGMGPLRHHGEVFLFGFKLTCVLVPFFFEFMLRFNNIIYQW